jgi:hypothetical protein
VQLVFKDRHPSDHGRKNLVRGGQILIGQIRQGRTDMSPKRSEEGVSQRHATILVAQEPLTSILGIGLAPDVARFDHPVHQIGNRRRRHVHSLPKLRQGQGCAGRLRHHDVQKGMEIAATDVVHAGEVPSDTIRPSGDRAEIGRQQLLQVRPARGWDISTPFGQLPASFINYIGYGVPGWEFGPIGYASDATSPI